MPQDEPYLMTLLSNINFTHQEEILTGYKEASHFDCLRETSYGRFSGTPPPPPPPPPPPYKRHTQFSTNPRFLLSVLLIIKRVETNLFIDTNIS